jgi:hypothetical protein
MPLRRLTPVTTATRLRSGSGSRCSSIAAGPVSGMGLVSALSCDEVQYQVSPVLVDMRVVMSAAHFVNVATIAAMARRRV